MKIQFTYYFSILATFAGVNAALASTCIYDCLDPDASASCRRGRVGTRLEQKPKLQHLLHYLAGLRSPIKALTRALLHARVIYLRNWVWVILMQVLFSTGYVTLGRLVGVLTASREG
ncbi:hypothetical protein EV702DRAFT_1050224 [Suillus placidus]|uniref:Uncharacterized protein n=1 Tax=Suillus placidus TaxID=48579 RepID=A0A9P7CXZ7_9AGAM|nr:hypothetical protein EV702DRAFT_1050224 [Suillus placidus]